MFIVAITKGDRQFHWPGLECTAFRRGTWTLTVGVNSAGAQVTAHGNGFSLVESPLAGVSPQPEALRVATVELTADGAELRITKPLFSGRPIYFHQNAAGEFFCATHTARLRDCGVRLEPDEAALPEYLLYRYLVPPATLYKSVHLLPLGARVRVQLASERCAIGEIEYWSPPEPDSRASREDLAAELVHRLMTRLQQLAPVQSHLAVLLSGGLDSTTLFRVAQKLFGLQESYSTGYPFKEAGRNVEREYAESAAAALGSRHHYYESTTADYQRGLFPAIAAAEEPVHHFQSVMLYLLFARGLPADKTVVISGEGADGMVGGELQARIWRREHKTGLLTLASRFPGPAAIRWLTALAGHGTGFFEPVLMAPPGRDFENPEHELWPLGCYGSKSWVRERFGCRQEDLFRSRLECVNRLRDRSICDVVSLLALTGEGAATQRVWSKLGEACGRFVDYTFLGPELLEFAYRTSWQDKLREPKRLIRGALRRLEVPEFIIQRPESSFGLRSGWATKRGSLFEPLVPLAAKVFPEREFRSLQSDGAGPREASTFWALLNYALWKRLCVEGEPLEQLQEELERQLSGDAAGLSRPLERREVVSLR